MGCYSRLGDCDSTVTLVAEYFRRSPLPPLSCSYFYPSYCPPPTHPASRTCQRLAHELRYYNLDAPQLDERLRPVEPDTRLLLVGGCGPEDGSDPASQWVQDWDHKVQGWGRLMEMSEERPYGPGTAAIGTHLYAFGGEADGVDEPGRTTLYDMATRKMDDAAAPPRALQFCAGTACDGCVYSLGGLDEVLMTKVADVCIYNPETDSWTKGPALPYVVSSMAAAEHAGCIYVCGGGLGPPAAASGPPTSAGLLMLDPRTRAWTALPPMPTPVVGARAAVVAGRLYVPGELAN